MPEISPERLIIDAPYKGIKYKALDRMPSIVRSRHWFTQVDGPLDHLKQKLAILGVELEVAIATYHIGEKGDNPHMHLCSTMSKELQKQSWDTKIKKLFGVSGPKFSSKPWDQNLDGEGAGTYLFHETDTAQILLQKNVSDETVQNLRNLAKVVNKVVAAAREKAETKIPGKVLEKFHECGDKRVWTNQEIVETICTMAKEGQCYLPKSDWMWKAYIEEIKLKMGSTKEDFEHFVRSTYSRLYSY